MTTLRSLLNPCIKSFISLVFHNPTMISQNNEIQGLISIDTLHQPHTYDMINSHVVQLVPQMSQTVLTKLETLGIRYDIMIQPMNQLNPLVGFVQSVIDLCRCWIYHCQLNQPISRWKRGRLPGIGTRWGRWIWKSHAIHAEQQL